MGIAKSKKRTVFKRDLGHCHYCARMCDPFGPDNNMGSASTLDHKHRRVAGGPATNDNLILACAECNNLRGCIPYHVFLTERLWLPDNKPRCKVIGQFYSYAAESRHLNRKKTWLIEMFQDDGHLIRTEPFGRFASAVEVHKYMAKRFPGAISNGDDTVGMIGYHFKDPLLADISFVANAYDEVSE